MSAGMPVDEVGTSGLAQCPAARRALAAVFNKASGCGATAKTSGEPWVAAGASPCTPLTEEGTGAPCIGAEGVAPSADAGRSSE